MLWDLFNLNDLYNGILSIIWPMAYDYKIDYPRSHLENFSLEIYCFVT